MRSFAPPRYPIALRRSRRKRAIRAIRLSCSASSAIGAPGTASPGGKKVCFALSKPTQAATDPAGRNRDASYAFISTRPAEKVKNEVSVIVGYPQKPGHDASATVGSASYVMYTQNDGAWVKNAAEEALLVEAMRKGADLVVKSESSRGTKSTDTYSLKGVGEALDKVAAECSRSPAPYIAGRAARRADMMTEPMTSSVETASPALFVEKAPLVAYVAPEKPSLVGLSRAQLADVLGEVGVPPAQRKMRVQQLWHWIYFRGFTDFDGMTTMSKDLRAALAERFTVARPEVVVEQVSVDGTRKWLMRLPGDADSKLPHDIECVYIPDTERGTLCVSSQVGCTLTCSFCHTGTQRLVRNLTAGEIAGQVMVARDRLGDWPGGTRPTDGVIPTGDRCVTNIVMMGMGEPLYNFDAVRDALLIVSDGEGIGISKRRITLSTSGVVPNIERAGAEIGCMLAISLHAVRDELRNELVPLNRKYPIAQLMDACRNYPGASNAKRITFEYVMLKGVNDLARRRQGAGAAAQGHPGQDQSHPVQSLAGHQV